MIGPKYYLILFRIKVKIKLRRAFDIKDYGLYKKALESLYDGILISDKEGKVIFINDSYTSLTGLTREIMENRYLKDLEDEGVINQAISLDVIKSGEARSAIHKYITGKKAFTSAVPMFEDGELTGVINTTRDLDELLKMRNLAEKSETGKLKLEMDSLRKLLNEDVDFIAESPAMLEVLSKANKAAPFDTTVLITGESGTGKEVIARYIHNNSQRKNETFIRVNCAAIPSELFESELFGYEEGAFTGASESGKIGMFELADKGTILLDEIGELPYEMQSKLLRTIQEKEIQRVGGNELIPIDVRILASTNRDLAKEVKEGNFRDDLYYRINVFPIHIEALKNRREDIEPLISNSIARLNKKYNTTTTIERDALRALKNYDFPGNVRELENIIEYMYVLSTDSIKLESIPGKVLTKVMISSRSEEADDQGTLNDLMDLYEKTIIEDTIVHYSSLGSAADTLGIHPSTLSRKMKKYDLSFHKG